MGRLIQAGIVAVLALGLGAGARADEAVMAFSLEEVTGSISERAEQAPRSLAPRPEPSGAEGAVAGMMAELRWGMSSKALVAVLKARVRAEYARKIKLERDILRQDDLYQEAQARIAAVGDAFVVFDTRKNGWDASQIAPEFRRGTHETMLWVKHDQGRDYYFFVEDRLWKWYRELDSSTRPESFDGVALTLEEQLGPATRTATRRSDDAPVQDAAIWQTSQTRVTLLDRGVTPCLIFESQSVLGELATLREHAMQRSTASNHVIDSVIMDPSARERFRQRGY